MNKLNDYWEALSRLKHNKPINIPPNSKINNDTVALEAGRKRGSIKKSRKAFSDLIKQIDLAASAQTNSDPAQTINRLKALKLNYQEKYHQALNREIMLLNRVAELEKELNKLSNVVTLQK